MSSSSSGVPRPPEEFATTTDESDNPTGSRIGLALLPYVLVVIIIAITKLAKPVAAFFSSTDVKIHWPGVYGNLLTADGTPSSAAIYSLSILSNPGTWIFRHRYHRRHRVRHELLERSLPDLRG